MKNRNFIAFVRISLSSCESYIVKVESTEKNFLDIEQVILQSLYSARIVPSSSMKVLETFEDTLVEMVSMGKVGINVYQIVSVNFISIEYV
jgi:hypothetical protein